MLLAEEAAHAPMGLIFGIFFAFWVVVLVTLAIAIPALIKHGEKKSGGAGHSGH